MPLPVDFAACGADALTVTGHKLGGPYGAGALLLRRDVDCVPLLHGGGQERDVRSGTLDVPGAVGLADRGAIWPCSVASRDRAAACGQLRGSARRRHPGEIVPDAIVNGHPTESLPGIAHLSFPGCEGDSLLMLLDARGIECSTGSACSAGVAQPSHVLLAMGADAGAGARVAAVLARAHLRPTPTSTRCWTRSDPVVERARARPALTSGRTR